MTKVREIFEELDERFKLLLLIFEAEEIFLDRKLLENVLVVLGKLALKLKQLFLVSQERPWNSRRSARLRLPCLNMEDRLQALVEYLKQARQARYELPNS